MIKRGDFIAYDGKIEFETDIDKEGFYKGLEDIERYTASSLQHIRQLGDESVENIKESISATSDAMKSLATGGLSGVTLGGFKVDLSGIKNGISQIGSLASKGLDGVKSIATGTLDLIKSSVTATVDVMKKVGDVGTSFLKDSVSTGKDYEASLSQVLSTSGKDKNSTALVTNQDTGLKEEVNVYDALSDKSKELGASTQFSASQVADAFNYMALAGWDTEKQLSSIDGVLDLAAASGLELGQTCDIVTDYLSAFGMGAEQSGEMADMMAYAQSNANLTVENLADSWKNCAANMNANGQSIQTTTALLSKMADQGYKGSEAGSSLSAIMRDMSASMEDGQIMIGDTAVAVADSQGNYRDMTDILKDVEGAVGSLSETERTTALSTSFTSDSIKGLNLLLNAGADNVADFEESLHDVDGTSKKAANTLNDNLEGDLKGLSSAFEGVQIAIYDGMMNPLRELTQNGTKYLQEFNSALNDGGIVGFASSIGDVMTEALSDNQDVIKDALLTGQLVVSNLLQGLRSNSEKISTIVVDLLKSAISSSSATFTGFYQIGFKMISQLLEGFADNPAILKNTLKDAIISMVNTISNYVPTILDAGIIIIEALADGIIEALPIINPMITELLKKIMLLIRNNTSTLLKAGADILKGLLSGIGSNSNILAVTIADFISEVVHFVIDNIDILIDAGKQLIEGLLLGFSEGGLAETVLYLINTLVENLNKYIFVFVNVAESIILALANGIIANLPALLQAGLEIILKLVNAISTFLPDLIPVAIDLLKMLSQFIIDNIDLLINTAVEILLNLTDFLIDNLPLLLDCGLEIITEILSALSQNTDTLVDGAIEIISRLADFIIDNLPELLDCADELISKIVFFIGECAGDLIEGALKIIAKIVEYLSDEKNLEKLGEFVKSLFDKIMGFITGTNWAEIGKRIGEGILSGLWGEDMTGYFDQNASEWVDNWVTGFKDLLGIHSPSKLMADEIGKYIPQGISVGVEDEIPSTSKSINGSIEEMVNAINIDDVYTKMQGLTIAQGAGSVPSYSDVSQKITAPAQEKVNQDEDNTNDDDGDWTFPIYLYPNSNEIDKVVITSVQRVNARSGGRTL